MAHGTVAHPPRGVTPTRSKCLSPGGPTPSSGVSGSTPPTSPVGGSGRGSGATTSTFDAVAKATARLDPHRRRPPA